MKNIILILAGLGLLAAGCATDKGGTSDDYYKGYGTRMGNPTSEGPASTTFRPGRNPDDIRDPSGLAVPWRVPPS
jgi:hypothetical protein